MVLLFCFVASGTVTNLFPTVVGTLGYSHVVSLLLTVPPYALGVMTTFLNAWHADRTGERYFHVTLPLYIAVIAFIIAATTTKTGPRYLAMMLMIPGVYTGYVVALAWISNTLPRPPAKVRFSDVWFQIQYADMRLLAGCCLGSYQCCIELQFNICELYVP